MLLHCTNSLHELGTAARHMEIYQLPQCYARAEYVLVLHKLSSRTGNGCSPYGNLPTTTMLRLGGICFGIAQTIFTNWGRRLAIWKFTNYHNATLGRNMFWYCTNYLHELGTAACHMEIYQLPQCYARAEYVLVLHKLSSRTGNGGSPCGCDK